MRMSNGHISTLSEHAAFFFDLPFINDLVPQSEVRIQECIFILKKYPEMANDSVIYRLENISEQIAHGQYSVDKIRKVLETIPSLLQAVEYKK